MDISASIIDTVKIWCTKGISGWAFFFFDSRNANKGLLLYENFLRSILSQLCSRCGGTPADVKILYYAHGKGREQPSVKALEETLRKVLLAFDDVYIIIDSLDESGDRAEVLQWIENVAKWNSARWHILTTSRPEHDITSALELIPNAHTIRLQGSELDRDIITYVNARLSRSHWSNQIQALIEAKVVGGANGM